MDISSTGNDISFSKNQGTFFRTGVAKSASGFAGKRHKVLIPAISATYTRESVLVEASEFIVETGYMRPVTDGEKGKRIPVISWVRAGRWKEIRDQEESGEFVETDTKGELALRVEGDSMEPEFRKGDIIVVDPYRKQEQNDYVVVCNAEYEATLKQLKKYGKTRVLHPLNPKYEDIELTKDSGHTLIGVVVEKRKKY